MNIQDIHKSKTIRGILIGLGIAILLLVIFQAGQAFGYRKARFAGNFNNNFERNFLGSKGGGIRSVMSERLPGGHGAIGEIVSINLPQLVVAGPDNLEKTVNITTSTLLRRFQDEIDISELKQGEFIVVLGNPNESGQIEAKLIRVMPSPPEGSARIIPR